MKYQVVYEKPKKKKISKQSVIFYQIEDAFAWEKHVKEQGCFGVEILPVF